MYIRTKDTDDNDHYISVVDSMTYNLTPMWRKALPFLGDVRNFDGQKCEDILLTLQIAVTDLELNWDEYERLNPSNGWGNIKIFYHTLYDLFYKCRRYPSGVLDWMG